MLGKAALGRVCAGSLEENKLKPNTSVSSDMGAQCAAFQNSGLTEALPAVTSTPRKDQSLHPCQDDLQISPSNTLIQSFVPK